MIPFVGLTGGFACGKSAAAKIFAEFGAAVEDADDISRFLCAPGGAAIPLIRREFGDGFLTEDGGLNRPQMRARIFGGDDSARRLLESILHPLIRTEMQKRMKIAQADCGYGIAVVPLLLESPELKAMMRRIVVADCDAQTQMQRAKARIGWRESEIKSAMAAQMPREKRRNLADDILENDGDFSSLKKQVAELHRRFYNSFGNRPKK